MDAKGIYATARAAGFTSYQARIATAIAMAESGGNPAAVGDTALTNATWGPSIGLWQIRSLRAHKGTGKERDETRLSDPLFNAKAAYKISAAGTIWSPWSVYKSGAYQQYLLDATGAMIAADPRINGMRVKDESSWIKVLAEFGVSVSSLPIAIAGGAGEAADAIQSIAGSPLAAAASALGLVAKAGAWMADTHNWARVAMVVGGTAGVLAGLAMLAKAGAGPVSSAAGAPLKAAKAAANLAPAGRVAKAVAKAR